jgi:hypothetical protein
VTIHNQVTTMASRSTSLPANRRLDPIGEEHLARLTDAAYRVALQHGLTGSFLDLQLDLWAALR